MFPVNVNAVKNWQLQGTITRCKNKQQKSLKIGFVNTTHKISGMPVAVNKNMIFFFFNFI